MKKPKQWEGFEKFVDDKWKTQHLAQLRKKYGVTNDVELRAKLSERGESLDDMKEAFRLDNMAQEFLMSQVGPRLKPSMPAMLGYYHEHIKAFDRPAQVTWREIVVRIDENLDRVKARRKADELLARLRRGDDFAKLAKAESQGPTAEKGGAWETSPDSHASPAVNHALSALRVGEISQILEASDGFHILRVEARRAAGPAPFGEVQTQITKVIFEENYEREVGAYLRKLRKRTPIATKFDQTDSAPSTTKNGPVADQ
jgi:peptidyl-prolyl cis-trans isomerase SurA